MSAARFLLLLGALLAIGMAAEREPVDKQVFGVLVGICGAFAFAAWVWGWS